MDSESAAPVNADGEVGHVDAVDNVADLVTQKDLNRYLVTGFEGSEIWVLDVSDPAGPRWMTDHSVISAGGEFGAYLEIDTDRVKRCILMNPAQAISVP